MSLAELARWIAWCSEWPDECLAVVFAWWSEWMVRAS